MADKFIVIQLPERTEEEVKQVAQLIEKTFHMQQLVNYCIITDVSAALGQRIDNSLTWLLRNKLQPETTRPTRNDRP